MSKLRILVLAPVLLMLAGCFPIELDSRDGKLLIPREEGFFLFDPVSGKARKLAEPVEGKPVFARFAPNGKEVLTVTKVTRGFNQFRFDVLPLEGGKPREVYRGQNTAYVRYAPDGGSLGVIRASEKDDPKMKDKVLELHLVPLQVRETRTLAVNVGVLFRWFPDSRRILIFDVIKKDDKNSYHGNIAVVDVASGKKTGLAGVVSTRDYFFDLSPDGQKVLFTALRAGKVDENLDKGEEFKMTLFEVDTSSRELYKTNREARYAVYSPSGKQILLGSPPKGFSLDTLTLEVAGADLAKPTVVATDAHMPLISFGVEGITFPGWIDDKTIYYFVTRAVYGTEGKSLNLMRVGVDGQERKCIQPAIDSEATKDVK